MLAYNKQIDKRTTMRNQTRNAALGWPAMKLLGGFNYYLRNIEIKIKTKMKQT